MTKQRRNLKAADSPMPAGLQSDPTPSPSVTEWAHGLIRELTGQITSRESALLAAQVDALGRGGPAATELPPDPTKPTITRDLESLRTLGTKIADAPDVVVDLETSDLDHRKGVIVGIGLALDDSTFYVPLNHRFEGGGGLRPGQLTLLDVINCLKLNDKLLIGHNVKYEMKWLRHHAGLTLRFAWDTMIAARLLRSNLSAELKDVAVRELDVPDWDLPQADKRRIQFLPIERVASYCAKDCWYTLMLYRRQRACLA